MLTTKRPTQGQRILTVLADGHWHSSAAIHRRAGSMVLHSRIASLREKGYRIEHRTVPGKTGAHGHAYRWTDAPPLPPAVAVFQPDMPAPVDTDTVWPRTLEYRYRLYGRDAFDNGLSVVAACATPEAVGVALVTLGREKQFRDKAFGLMDVCPNGERCESGAWLVLPWEPQ
jgi:hypothetical protein